MTQQDYDEERYKDTVGFIKLKGNIDNGIISATSAINILTAVNGILSSELVKEYPALKNQKLDIPIAVREGSWEALIPNTIGEWIMSGAGIAATAYASTAATKLAGNDFKDKTTKEIVKNALTKAQATLRIAKHLGGLKKKPVKVRFKDSNKTLTLVNESGGNLDTTKESYDNYYGFSSQDIESLARSLRQDQALEVGVNEGGTIKRESITYKERELFVSEDEIDPEILFPELEQGKEVKITGYVSRGNNNSNTIGFQYKGHILTCVPARGKIADYKYQLFTICSMTGVVQRVMDNTVLQTVNRPKILFSSLEVIAGSSTEKQTSLLE